MAQPKTFRIHFDISENKLSTIISLLASEVSNLVVRDTATIAGATPVPAPKSPPRPRSPAEKSAIGCIFDVLKDVKPGDEIPYTKICDILVTNGYKASSHTSIISGIVTHGYVERHKAGWLRVLKKLAR